MEAHTIVDIEKIITDLTQQHNLDIAITEPEFNEEKKDYKKVYYWEDKEKYNGQKVNGHQLIIRNSKEYLELDFDFMKLMSAERAAEIINIIPSTLTFGRAAAGHALFKVTNTPDDAITIRVYFAGSCINEFRTAGSYSILYGPLDKVDRAEIANRPIVEIDYQKLKKLFRYQNILAALTIITGDNNTGDMNNLLLAIGGEFYNSKIPEETSIRIITKWHSIIGRNDRLNESLGCIKGIYKTGKASNIFSKSHYVPIDDAAKHQFRKIVKELIEKKEETKAPTKLNSYNMQEYLALGIIPTKFVVERLIKEHSLTFISGPKGNGKTEFVLGLLNSLCRGKDFLGYTCPIAIPVNYNDGEMDPYDLIERSEPYIEKLGQLKDPNYFNIVNHAQQKDETIPDIKTEIGQKLIEDQAELTLKRTGKHPFIVLDNLRSLSNYKENDSDEYRLINSWLLKLRARKYSIIVIDHHGKAIGGGPRGTSTKTDNANTSILINSVREKGNPFMVMKVAFDKARGLKPNETDEFEAVYDFAGGWTKQEARAPKGQDDICIQIKAVKDAHEKAEAAYFVGLDAQLDQGKIDAKSYATIKKNHKGNLTQKDLAAKINTSVGKLNSILKDGVYQAWLDKMAEEEKTSPF